MKKQRRKKYRWDVLDVTAVIILTLLFLFILVPVWNAVVISLDTSLGQARNGFSLLPGDFTLDNYKYLLSVGEAIRLGYQGTLITALVGTTVKMVISTMGAYAFSRRFPGKVTLFRLMFLTMFFSGGTVPMYLQLKKMGLINTYTALILLGLVSVYDIIIMKNGFESVPMDLQEASRIDGANDMQIFWKVMLPLQKPLLATFTLFGLVNYWNSYFWPMLLLSNGKKSVLQLYLRNLLSSVDLIDQNVSLVGAAMGNAYSEGLKMAAIFFVMLPMMVIYPFLQKYFAKGMLVGAVKM